MSDAIVSQLELWGLNPYLIVIILAMMPIGELRASMIFAAAAGLDWHLSLILSVVFNVVPIPFVILLLRPVLEWIKRMKWIGKYATKFHNKILEKSKKVQKYEKYGLFAFVGIPLPGTGAWTGAAIAAILDMRLKRSMPPIILGVASAGIIMTVVSYGASALISLI